MMLLEKTFNILFFITRKLMKYGIHIYLASSAEILHTNFLHRERMRVLYVFAIIIVACRAVAKQRPPAIPDPFLGNG
jgi:hypothetical protein